MEIHKPKPWHGVREFLKEYAIIVAGVLTALAGEQFVEWVHRSDEIRDAREAIHDEIATNMTIAAFGVGESRCLKPYLAADRDWSRGGPRPTNWAPLNLPLRSSVWETVKAGPVAKMPLKERLALADFYDWVANYQGALRDTRADSLLLQSIWARSANLDSATAGRLQEVVRNSQIMSVILDANAGTILASAAALGVKPKARVDIRPLQLRNVIAIKCDAPSFPSPTMDVES